MYEPLYLPPRNKVSPAPANGQFPEATSYSEKNQLNKEGSQQYPTASSEQESDFGDLDVPWLPFDRNEEEEIQEDLDIPMPWESKEADNSNNKELDRSVGDGSGDAHRPQSASSWLPGWMSGERGDAKMAAASKKQSPTRHSSESMIPPLPSWMGGTPEPPPETAPLSYHQASALTGRALLNKDPPSHAELCGCLGPRKAQAKKVPGDLDLLPSSSGYQEEYPPPLPIQSDNVQAALAV